MKALLILASGFEDAEAIVSLDLLKRSQIEVQTCSLDSFQVCSQYGQTFTSDILIKDVNVDDFQVLIIPGGRAVNEVLAFDIRIKKIILAFYERNILIAAICAAPLLIGTLGLFKNLEYTCFPGSEKTITEGMKKNQGVVVNQYFITAQSVYYVFEFALAIIEKLQGKQQRKKIFNMICPEQ